MAGTGSFWCHEQWNLSSPPDFVTFAKKMLSCGFYHTEETKMETPNRHFNTYFGDPLRAWLTVAGFKLSVKFGAPAWCSAIYSHFLVLFKYLNFNNLL